MTSPTPRHRVLLALCLMLPVAAVAQYVPAPRAPQAPQAAPAQQETPTTQAPQAQASGPSPLDAFAWLAGCWEGKVNQRDFREEWLPLRGDIMVGASQTAMRGKTLNYEFLRLEPRADAVYYIPMPSGRKESLFKLASRKTDGDDEIFTFENAAAAEFPQRIIYRHGTGGWLYAHVAGQVDGKAREVIYPYRRVDCQTGELLHK